MENHEQVDYTVCNTKYLMFQVQPVQHVYPSQVQYVEGGDAVYTNGALYVVSLPSEGASQRTSGHTWNLPSPLSHHFPFGDVFTQTPSPYLLGAMLEPLLWY